MALGEFLLLLLLVFILLRYPISTEKFYTKTGAISMAKFKRKTPIASTPITIDDTTYQLRYDFYAFRQAEIELTKLWGKRTTIPGLLGSIFETSEGTQVLSDKVSVSDLTILIWCGLLHEDATLSLDEVSQGLDLSDLATLFPIVINAIGESMTRATPEQQTAKNEETPQTV